MGLAVVFQMTFVGMPCVFYGDEMAVSGEKECDYRRPMPWNGKTGYLFDLYSELIKLRNNEPALRYGDFEVVDISPEGIYSYSRTTPDDRLFITINRTEKPYSGNFGKVICQRGYEDGTLLPYGFVIFR